MALTKLKSSGIADGAVTATDIAANSITVAQMARAGTSGQVLTSAGTGADASWATVAGGKILQVVQTVVTASTASTTSTSFVDITGMTLSITPSAVTSKVMVFVNCNTGSQALYRNSLRLMRDSTPIFIGDQYGLNRSRATLFAAMDDSQVICNSAGQYLDTPSTTSATTYKLQWQVESSAVYLNRSYSGPDDVDHVSTSSTITAMEVGA
tara:strand:+ start:1624 stop:2253 length:630 start_codon:yes stop_codon:yes gene_type:complete